MILPLGLMPSDELGPNYECTSSCPGFRSGVYHVPSASWTHEKCGTTGIFGAHICPAEHNHALSDGQIGTNHKWFDPSDYEPYPSMVRPL